MTHVPHNPAGGSGADQPEPGWGAHRLDPDDPLLLERLGLVIPDDARELDGYRREPPRGRPLRRSHPQLAALLVTLAMLAGTFALTGTLIGVMSPTADLPSRTAYALEPNPESTPGAVGGLVPDAGLTLDGAVGVSAQNLRPAVLFVPPVGAACASCAAVLGALERQAAEYQLTLYVLTELDTAADGRDLLDRARTDSAHLLVDPSGMLTTAFAGPEARAVLVHADGVIGAVLTDPSPRDRFEQFLSPLRLPGGASSLQPATTSD